MHELLFLEFTHVRHQLLYALVTSKVAPGVLGKIARVVAGGKRASEAAKNEEEGGQDKGENNELPEGRVAGPVVSPGATSSTSIFLELVCSELVVYKTTEGDRVTEELQRRDGVAEDSHGGDDQQNIFEHSGESKDERRSPSDLKDC